MTYIYIYIYIHIYIYNTGGVGGRRGKQQVVAVQAEADAAAVEAGHHSCPLSLSSAHLLFLSSSVLY